MSFTYPPGFTSPLVSSPMDGLIDADNNTGTMMDPSNTSTYTGHPAPISGGQWLLVLAMPLIVLLGTLGNLMTMAVLLRPKFRKLNVNVYLFSLAVADTIFLWTNSLTRVFIKLSLGVNYSTGSLQACQAYVFILYTSKCLSAWFIVAVTVGRALAILFPFRLKRSGGRTRAIIVVIVLTVLACVAFAFAPKLHTVEWDEQDQEDRCKVTEPYKELRYDVYLKLGDLLVYSLLPTIALVISNTALIYRLVSSINFRQANTEPLTDRTTKQDRSARQLTITLILVSVCFLIFTLPLSAFLLYSTLYPDRVGSFGTIYLSLYTLEVLNSSINFLLYCVRGPTFRAEVRLGWQWVCKKVCWRRDTRRPGVGEKVGESPAQSLDSLQAVSNMTGTSGVSVTPTSSTDDLATKV